MITLNIRKQGGAAVITIPSDILKLLNIEVDEVYAARSELAVEKDITKRSHEKNT